MKNLNYAMKEDRHTAKKEFRAVRHRDGPLGYISLVNYYDAEVTFPDWKGNGKRTYTYGQYTTSLQILNQTYEDCVTQKDNKEMTQALYEITKEDGSKVFATKMAEKSKTLWVMEIKGTGEFVAVETSRVQEVVPFTIKVKPVGNGNVCHYEAEENKFSVGDLLVLKNGDIVAVVELDTKQKLVSELRAQAKLATVAL